MKRLVTLVTIVTCLAIGAFGQAGTLPNISYYGQLTSTCSTPNAACSGGVVAGAGGVPSLPQSNTGILGAGSTLDVPVTNYNAAFVSVSGTYAGSTIAFDVGDNQGVYYQVVCARTDINLLEASEVLPTNQTRAWQCPTWGSYRFRIRQSAFTSGVPTVGITLTQAAIDPSLVVAASITNIAGASDPCQDVSAIKSSVAVNVTTATTTQLVALSGTTKVYVCGGQLTIAGSATTADTAQLEYGTGATCGTGTTALTGLYGGGIILAAASTSGIAVEIPGAMTSMATPAGNALCLVSAGTTVSIQGHITYVQQ